MIFPNLEVIIELYQAIDLKMSKFQCTKNLRSGLLSLVFIQISLLGFSQNKPEDVAGIPVNYDEAKVGTYELPDPLMSKSGQRTSDSTHWIYERRPEILSLFESEQFGKVPPAPGKLNFEITEQGNQALGGKAIRKQVSIYLTDPKTALHKIDLLIYLPAKAVGPAPLLLNASFGTNENIIADPAIIPGQKWDGNGQRVPSKPSEYWKIDVEKFIDAGIGFASFCYTDIEPDSSDGIRFGIRSTYLPEGQDAVKADEWGAISAWSWGMSRIMDYLELDQDIDEKRIALTGASRLGKTVLWTGARDQRFSVIIASISGEGGAAISRRNFGETVAHLTAPTRYPYQFAGNYGKYAEDLSNMPFDSHSLLALIAPRPLLLQTGSTDFWSDPKGEWEALQAAKPVYQLLGQSAAPAASWPEAGDESQMMYGLGYVMHEGGHGVLPEDWDRFVRYLKQFLIAE